MTVPILQMTQLSLRKVNSLATIHSASKVLVNLQVRTFMFIPNFKENFKRNLLVKTVKSKLKG